MERYSKFLLGVAVVLFLGLCSCFGAALGLIAGREYSTVTAETATATRSVPLERTALRQERVIRSSFKIIVHDGARVADGARLTEGNASEALTAEYSLAEISGKADGLPEGAEVVRPGPAIERKG